MKKTAIYLFLIFGICFCRLAYSQVNYPNPTGHVNDFANLLSSQSKEELEQKLKEYGEQTSIEVAVVTVPSLEGLTVEEYTLNLAQKWGVGDKEKDNGIVVLVASNERKLRIEVGYGMEPDLTDAQAGRIIQGTIIPYFRNNQMAEGIVAGVNAILTDLGGTPYQARVEERKLAEEKRLAEEKKRAEEVAVFIKTAGVALFIGAIILAVVFAIYKTIRHRQALRKQDSDNVSLLRKCELLLEEAKKEYPKAKERLDDLRQDGPKTIWADLEKLLGQAPGQIESGEKKLGQLGKLRLENGWQGSEKTAVKIGELLIVATALANLLDDVNAKTKEVRTAKEKSPKLLKDLASSIESTEGDLGNKDISKKTKKCLDDAKDQHNKAKSLMDNSLVDWLVVYGLITGAIALISQAKSGVKSDKAAAEEARRPKPRRSTYDDDSYHSSSSSSWSSSGSGSGGGFGGFGGGSFGGGGASGSW